MTSTSTNTRRGGSVDEVLSLERLRECPTRIGGLQVRVMPDPHWTRLVVSDDDGAVEMRWLTDRWASRAGTAGLSVALHSVHPVCPDRWAEEQGIDCDLTGDEVTVGVCYPDSLGEDALARSVRPVFDVDHLDPVIEVLARYHRNLLHR